MLMIYELNKLSELNPLTPEVWTKYIYLIVYYLLT